MCRLVFLTLLLLVAASGVTSCRKKAPAPPKEKVEDRLRRVDRERRALAAFVADLRAVLEWRQTLPVPLPKAERGAMLERFQKVRLEEGLPEELAAPWSALLQVSEQLLAPSSNADELRRKGGDLAGEINRALARFGYSEVRL